MRLGQLKGTFSKTNLNSNIFMRENHSFCRDSVLRTSHDPPYNWSAFSLKDRETFEGASEGRSTMYGR